MWPPVTSLILLAKAELDVVRPFALECMTVVEKAKNLGIV
jgi:hypothetical protein